MDNGLQPRQHQFGTLDFDPVTLSAKKYAEPAQESSENTTELNNISIWKWKPITYALPSQEMALSLATCQLGQLELKILLKPLPKP